MDETSAPQEDADAEREPPVSQHADCEFVHAAPVRWTCRERYAIRIAPINRLRPIFRRVGRSRVEVSRRMTRLDLSQLKAQRCARRVDLGRVSLRLAQPYMLSASQDGHATFAGSRKEIVAENSSKLDKIRKLREAHLLKVERATASCEADEKPPERKKLAEDK